MAMEKKNQQKEAIEKPTYEELNGYVNELMMENRNLSQRLHQVMNVQNKLPLLLEIVKMKDIFGEEYVAAAVKEIKLILPPYKEPTPQEESLNNSESHTVAPPDED